MNDLSTERLKALREKITQGPWPLETVPTSVGLCHKIGNFPSSRPDKESHACVYGDHLIPGHDDKSVRGVELRANAEAIALVPALLDALLAARESLEKIARSDQQAFQMTESAARATARRYLEAHDED